MPLLQLLIKPASGSCNMRCNYCFYMDEMENRACASYGYMTIETLELLVKKALEYADGVCTFAFQGGEPTLVGIEFYEELLRLQKRYNTKKIRIDNVLQTNGYALDEKWAAFFAENHFLVGLSVDGIGTTHNAWRKDVNGNDTFERVMKAAELLRRAGAEFNVLTVVNNKTAARVSRIYQFYKKNGFAYQQYIACLNPLHAEKEPEYALTPEAYGKFMSELFDLWYLDLTKGQQPYIRQFENYVGILLGAEPEACEMKGLCGNQNVVEADGSVYPCDFYVLDDYKIGNVREDSFEQILENSIAMKFTEKSVITDKECRECKYFPLCRGGCGRHRMDAEGKRTGRNRFCRSYQMFFNAALPRLLDIAEKIRRNCEASSKF